MAQRISSGAVLQSTGYQVCSLVMADDVLISCCSLSWVTREKEWIYLTDRHIGTSQLVSSTITPSTLHQVGERELCRLLSML